jgi:hypothetical protein
VKGSVALMQYKIILKASVGPKGLGANARPAGLEVA